MKRVYPALIALLLVLGVSFFSLYHTQTVAETALAQVEKMMEYTKIGRFAQTADLGKQFFDFWEHSEQSMTWYTSRQTLDKITCLACQLEPAAKNQDTARLHTLLAQLTVQLKQLGQSEFPSLKNLS